jgi:hypothetical protein
MGCDPKEGDSINFKLKGVKLTQGEVVKRVGLRLRVQHEGQTIWVEMRDVVSVVGSDTAQIEPEAPKARIPPCCRRPKVRVCAAHHMAKP